MKTLADCLFDMMKSDIKTICKKELGEQETIESCYQVCNNYWTRLAHHLSTYLFADVQEEIEFFKTVKPKFTSEIEYYNLLYQATLFKPEADVIELDDVWKKEIEKFWKREEERLKRFEEDNKEFYCYYKNNLTNNDETWFVREYGGEFNLKTSKPYDMKIDTTSSHDGLVATVMALERYTEYVRLQLSNLQS